MIFPSRYFSHYNKGGDDYLRLDDDDYTGICGCFSRFYDDRTLQQIIMMTMMIMIMMTMIDDYDDDTNSRCEHPTSKHCHHSCGDDLVLRDGGW